MNLIDQPLGQLSRDIGRRDFALTQCYVVGIFVAAMLMSIPLHLVRTGAVVMLVSLLAMLHRICLTHQQHEPIAGIRARLSLNRSLIHNLPFLVGANLAFMGLPVTPLPLFKATLDCLFLAGTVTLFLLAYLINQLAFNRRVARYLASTRTHGSS